MNQPAEPFRTAPPVYQGGRIYECDPAAVARLKRLMAEQRRAKEAAEAERLARQIDHAARLRAEAKRRRAQQVASEPELKPKQVKKLGRPRRRLTADELAAAVAAHNSGQTWRKVAAGMGISREALRDGLVAAGYDIHSQPKIRRGRTCRITNDVARAIHARQLGGEKLKDIAAEHGVSSGVCNRHFRRLGLTTVRSLRRNQPSPRRRNSDTQAAAAIEAHADGKLWREIAAEMGVPRTTLRGWIKAYEARQKPSASNGNSSTGNPNHDNPNHDCQHLDR